MTSSPLHTTVTLEDHAREMASTAALRQLLRATTIPRELIDRLLAEASPVWLLSAPPVLLATDLALTWPPLGPAEVRAVTHRLADGQTRLTVLGHDRPGLLADTAGVLAAAGLAVSGASAQTWTSDALALHALTADAPGWGPEQWAALTADLRALAGETHAAPIFVPIGPAFVSSSSQAGGRCVITVRAPDQVGLLWSICRWLADHGASIDAAHGSRDGGMAEISLVVTGRPDPEALATHLAPARAAV